MSIRFYLFAEDGLQRISHRVMEGLVHGKDAMPQFANSKQKVADVYLEMESGKPVRIERTAGNYLNFDGDGHVHKGLQESVVGALNTAHSLRAAQNKTKSSKVVDLSPQLERGKWERENRWELTKQDLDAISNDIWGRKKASSTKATQAKGSAPKPPPMTYEAKELLTDIQVKASTIIMKMEGLSDQSLKGLAFEARGMADCGFEAAFWRGIADTADLRREILSRHRTGKGVWYANVELVRWDDLRQRGDTILSVHEKCNSKAEAEKSAQRLLVENSKYFRADVSIEANVICDLEWVERESDA